MCILQAVKSEQEERGTAGTVQMWNPGIEA